MTDGFDFGDAINMSDTDDKYLYAACAKAADGDKSMCDNIKDAGQKGACQVAVNGGKGGNAFVIYVKPSCHGAEQTKQNICNIYNCQRNPVIADMDGHCDESVGCQGTFMMYTKIPSAVFT
jgi:hypothetical protein